MEKMLVAVFDSEEAAFNGLSELKELDQMGDISLFASSVLAKNSEGEISERQAADSGPLGAALGMLTGAVVGIVGGPPGMLAGMSFGVMTGLFYDLVRAGIDYDFLNEVSGALGEGKVAVIAHVDEGWTTPVDTRLEDLGGIVFRKLRSEVEEDQLAREEAALDAELDELETELKDASDEARARIEAQIEKTREKLEVTREVAKTKLDAVKNELDEKTSKLEAQLENAGERRRVKIEKRIEEAKADYAARSAKLKKAAGLMMGVVT